MQKPWKKEGEGGGGAAVAGAQTNCVRSTLPQVHELMGSSSPMHAALQSNRKPTPNHEGNIRGVLSTIRVHELHELLQQAFLPSPHPH
jgi:hypothetical protein